MGKTAEKKVGKTLFFGKGSGAAVISKRVIGPDGSTYRLTGDQVADYDEANATLEADADFWSWFRQYIKDNDLHPTTAMVTSTSGGSSFGWGEYKKNDYLGNMWKGWGYGKSDEAGKLAIALAAVDTTVHATRTRPGHYSVRLADKAHGDRSIDSYTDLKANKIVVSPDALLADIRKHKEATADAIEVTTGFALHEAGHAEHTEAVYDLVRDMKPVSIAAPLTNILEDVRIERLQGESYPGFADYFGKALDYMWGRSIEPRLKSGALQPVYGGDLNAKLNWIIAASRWPERWQEIVKDDPASVAEAQWWAEWVRKYNTGKRAVKPSIEDALARLREDEKTSKEMDDLSEAEGAAEKVMQKLAPILGCASRASDGELLASDTAEKVADMVAEGLEEVPIPNPLAPNAGHRYKVHRFRPKETNDSKALSPRVSNDQLNKLRSAFVFRPKDAEWTTRRLKSGQLDEEELWRVPTGDYRVFEQRTVAEKPDTDIALLVDMSGSMHGRIDTAARLAKMMLHTLRGTKGVSVRVRGHSGETVDFPKDAVVYRVWEPGDPDTRLGLLRSGQMAQNMDGYAIATCVTELMETGSPMNQKLLIVLSDGIPAAAAYGGEQGMAHVRQVTDWAEHHGVTVVQIAVDGALRPSDQSRMFRHWLPYTTDTKLASDLNKLLSKII